SERQMQVWLICSSEGVIFVLPPSQCPICGRIRNLTKHHRKKKKVFGKNNDTIYLCRDCHNDVENEITRRENAILRRHPEIYIGTLNDFLTGKMFRTIKRKHT
ncbi:MAG: hypothetical protein PHS34_09185, partial [Candidatus Omnitrophica bacterium]|nr:hypothetical protein [Candidatus Omnitrophota bacterium]